MLPGKPDLNTLVTVKYNELINSFNEMKKRREAIGGLKLQRNKVQTKYNAKKVDMLAINSAQNKYVAGELNYILSCIKVWKAEAILNFTVGNFDY